MSHRRQILDIMIGIVLLGLCHLVYLLLAGLMTYLLALLSTTFPILIAFSAFIGMSVLGIGLAQALYVVPLCLYLDKRRQQHAVVMGVLIGAVLTLFLNGSCFVLLLDVLPP